MIPEALTIISTMCMILLSDYVFPSASLNMEISGTERRAFFSLSKRIEDMNHQFFSLLSKENVRVRSYPRITLQVNQFLFWQSSFHEAQEIISLTSSEAWRVCLASEFRDLWPQKTLHAQPVYKER